MFREPLPNTAIRESLLPPVPMPRRSQQRHSLWYLLPPAISSSEIPTMMVSYLADQKPLPALNNQAHLVQKLHRLLFGTFFSHPVRKAGSMVQLGRNKRQAAV